MGMSFGDWVRRQLQLTEEELANLRLLAAFDVLVCRCEAARRRGAPAPLITASTRRCGGNSRQVTRRMLAQLGYTRGELRVIHRLLAGSNGGWQGLVLLFLTGQILSPEERKYARRQVRLFETVDDEVSRSR